MALEQIGNSLTCIVHFTASKAGKTGLTVTCDVYRVTSTATSLVSSQAATEIAKGAYFYRLSSSLVTAEGLYLFVFSTADTTVDQKDMVGGWAVSTAGVEYLDASVLSRSTLDAAGVQGALTAQGYTTTRAGYLDALNGLVAAIWASGTRTLTSFGTLAADVWSSPTRTLTSLGILAADTAAAVWAYAVSSLTVVGSVGRYLVQQLGHITANRVNTTGPLVGGALYVTRGADYLEEDGNALGPWTDATLVGVAGSVQVKRRSVKTGVVDTLTGNWDADTGTASLDAEHAATQEWELGAPAYASTVWFTRTTGGHKAALAHPPIHVREGVL